MNELKKNIISMYNDEGKEWLDALPEITRKIAKDHNLSSLTSVNNMTFNYVASGYQNHKPIIFKIGMNSKALTKEASCLKAFSKHAVAEVIAHDDNMIIMQRAVPGSTLKDHFPDNDIDATKLLCRSIKELHKASIPESHNFYHLSELFKALDQKLDIPDKILAKAKHLKDKLLSTTTKEVLLHGDLHHDNILKNGDQWLVIDPKGFMGDSAFEPAAYLCNPIPELLHKDNAKQIVSARIKLCAEKLEIPEQRIKDWLYVKSVLCWAWSLEDNLDPGYWEDFLEKISGEII